MWDTIVLENVTFGSETSRSVALEGWAVKFKLDSAQLYATMGKYQAIDNSYSKLEVYNNSVLDFKLGSGSFQGSNNTLIIGEGSSITFRDMQNGGSTAAFNVSMTGAGAYLNFIAKEGSSINHTGAITINAYTENVDASVEFGKFELGLFAKGVTLSSLTVNMEGWKAVDAAITKDNYKGYSNCYSIEQDADGKYWVVYANESSSVADLEWTGGAISWSSTQFGSQDFNAYDSVRFTTNDASVTITGDVTASEVTIAEGVSVSLDGGDYQLTSTKGIDVQGTLQLNDDAIADGVSLTAGSNGKLVINGEMDLESGLKDFTSTIQITTEGSLNISAANTSAAFVVDGTLNIDDYANNTQLSSSTTGAGLIVLDIDNKEVAIKGTSFANFTGTIDVVSGQLYVGNHNNGGGGGQAVTTSGDAKVIVREGSSLWVHLGDSNRTFASDVDLVSSSYLRNRDGHNVLTGDIRFNIVDPNAATPTYNASGRVQLTMYWDKNMRLEGLISGDGNVDLKAPTQGGTGSWKLTNNGNTFQGSYNLEDRTKLILGAENAAQYSTINLKGSSNATLELSQNATIKSLNSTAQANVVRTTATAATLTVTGGSTGFKGIIESNVTLNLTGGSFSINGEITNNGTINVRGSSTVLNLDTIGNQNAGRVFLDGGKILSANGNEDNRVKTIEHLSGSGEIEGSNWNVIWNIGELAGDGDITWRNNGVHWAPSVFNINGGTFTGTLTADRAEGYNQYDRGDYQSVLQINEGGAKTLAGAVVNLKGNGADAYMQMALNTAEVSIGGLEGTQYSHIYAGSAGIEGGEENKFCQNKADSTGTSVLKLASDEKHTYAGSVGAGISLEKSGAGMQTFSGDMSAFNGSLKVIEGELAFTAAEALKVNGLYVGPEKNTAEPAASEGANVGILTVANGIAASGAVTLVGGAVINGNLGLSTATDVSFDVASGAIALNGALTMSSTEAFVAALGDSLAGLTAGDILTVFTGLASFTIGNVTSADFTSADLSTWSNSDAVAAGQYTVEYQVNNNVGSIVIINRMDAVPEPASATLSLAALMMLCARRRRRK